VVVGLEVHLQLATAGKLFCGCGYRYGAEANTSVCPVCLGLPGALPVVRREAVEQAVRLAVALGCEVAERSGWARKSYVYPDLPKGYQITQYERPLGRGGALPLIGGGAGDAVPLRRLHLEEDAAKLVHAATASRVDFNRAGVPLVEVVSEPEIRGSRHGVAAAAEDFLRSLHRLVVTLGVSDGNLEQGHLRCDANLSLRRPGETALGRKVEIKNLNSFRHVARALHAEARRQEAVLADGEAVAEETRGFDETCGETFALRGKEEVEDYRYFPEPDLPPLVVSEERIARSRRELPELPWDRQRRWTALGVDPEAAVLLLAEPPLADYFEAAVAAWPEGVAEAGAAPLARWLRGELLAGMRQRAGGTAEGAAAAPPPSHLARLVAAVEAGRVSHTAGRQALAAMWESGDEPEAVIERLGLALVRDPRRIERWVEEVLAEDAELAARCRRGEDKLLGVLVGRVLARSGGAADPRQVRQALREALSSTAATAEPMAARP